jgi:UDPglucose 6-dehydrogenase
MGTGWRKNIRVKDCRYMKIAVIGSGYVGLVAGACFADVGNHVICVDRDPAKIALLESGGIPIYEPGLEDIVKRNVADRRLTFTTSTHDAVIASDFIFIAVGTPPGEDGAADLTHVLAVAEAIARAMDSYKIVVCKSTVPVGTCDRVGDVMRKFTQHKFDVVSNPEFLKEGAAIQDFMSPDRVVVGCDNPEAAQRVGDLYSAFMRRNERILVMKTRSSEMTKYASNSILATKISFMNEIANLCDAVGADVAEVRRGMSMDERIGPHFIYPGVGYGGSCLVGRESVLVRRGGVTSLTTFAALFDELAPDTSDVPAPIAVATPGLEVLSWSPADAHPTFRPVEAVTRRGYEGELVDVRTKMGRRVSVTTDHPFVVLEQGAAVTKLACELTTEDWLPVGRGAAAVGEAPSRLDVLSFLDDANIPASALIVRLGDAGKAALATLDKAQIKAKIDHPRGMDRVHDIVRGQTLKLDEAHALGLPLDDATFGTAKNGTYIPRWLPLNERFFKMLGLYLAEGHISGDGLRRRITWSFHPTKEGHLVDEIASFWRELGVKVDVRPGTTTMMVMISSRLLAGVWQSIGAGTSCYEHTIPDIVWDRSPSEQRALLAGIWQGDGSWSLINGGPSVVLEHGTVSRPLADGMLRLISALGVTARLKVGRTAKSTRDTYWHIISGADNVEAMIDLVNPAERVAVLDSVRSQAKRIAPTGTRELGHAGAVGVRITSLERRSYQGMVYSMEVPGAHTFVTSFGLVVHNCFPKDVRALAMLGKANGRRTDILDAVEDVNNAQKSRLLDFARGYFRGELAGKRFAVWGLSFKPRTDDVREAPALHAIRQLVAAGATVIATDPVAIHTAQPELADLGDAVTFCEDDYAMLEGADGLFVFTEWNEFRSPDFSRIAKALREKVVFDGRNIYRPSDVKAAGMTYFCIGRATVDPRW